MSESRLSVDGFAVEGEHEFFAAAREGRPGAFYFEHVVDLDAGAQSERIFLWVLVPGAREATAPGRLPVNQPDGWRWDGNRERPTLTPSIHCVGEWHGFLRAGRFESC